jgi:hypothetical protein
MGTVEIVRMYTNENREKKFPQQEMKDGNERQSK